MPRDKCVFPLNKEGKVIVKTTRSYDNTLVGNRQTAHFSQSRILHSCYSSSLLIFHWSCRNQASKLLELLFFAMYLCRMKCSMVSCSFMPNDRLKWKQVEYLGGSGNQCLKQSQSRKKKPKKKKIPNPVSVSNVFWLFWVLTYLLSDSCANNLDKMYHLGQACELCPPPEHKIPLFFTI